MLESYIESEFELRQCIGAQLASTWTLLPTGSSQPSDKLIASFRG